MKSARVLVAVVSAVLVLAGCAGKNAVDQNANGQFKYIGTTPRGKTIAVADRRAAGIVNGDLIGGGKYDVTADKGKVVVLNFWASWCPPCRTESPGLDSVYRSYKAKGVQFVGLDVKDPNRDAATSFLTDNKISYPIVYDPNARTALQLGKVPLSIGLPWTVILDKALRVAAVYNGAVLPKDLQPVIDALLRESAQ